MLGYKIQISIDTETYSYETLEKQQNSKTIINQSLIVPVLSIKHKLHLLISETIIDEGHPFTTN
jgi:hypothetical protein